MATAQRQYKSSAFRTDSTPAGLHTLPRNGGERGQIAARGGAQQSVPIPVPSAIPATAPSTRVEPIRKSGRQTEHLRITMMLAMCGFCVITGVAYLSGYAKLTYEGYRRVQLNSMLNSQMALAHQWRHTRAIVLTAGNIETQATSAGMVPADDQHVVIIR